MTTIIPFVRSDPPPLTIAGIPCCVECRKSLIDDDNYYEFNRGGARWCIPCGRAWLVTNLPNYRDPAWTEQEYQDAIARAGVPYATSFEGGEWRAKSV